MELENVHVDHVAQEPRTVPDSQRMDLENTVLIHELMDMKVGTMLHSDCW